MKKEKNTNLKFAMFIIASLIIVFSFTSQVLAFDVGGSGVHVKDDTVEEDTIITEHLGNYLAKPGTWYDRPFSKIWDALLTLQDQIYTLAQDVYKEPVVKPKESITVLKEVFDSGWISEDEYRHSQYDKYLKEININETGLNYDDLILDCKIRSKDVSYGHLFTVGIHDCYEYDGVYALLGKSVFGRYEPPKVTLVKENLQNSLAGEYSVTDYLYEQRVRLYAPVTIEIDK